MSNNYDQHFKKLRANAAKKPAAKKKEKRGKFPVGSTILAVIILAASTWAYLNIEDIENLLSKVEVQFFGSALAQEETKQTLPSATANGEKTAQDSTNENKDADATSRNLTPEELALFNKLEERKVELDQREAGLKKLEEELHKQELMLEEKMKNLESMRNNIALQLDDRVKSDATRVEKLVNMYSNMKPVAAAKVLETVNEDLAVEILQNMKKDRAADILNMISAAKAQKLSEKFAGYRKD